jgi:hypothetical protein
MKDGFPGEMCQSSPDAFLGTKTGAEIVELGKYRLNAQILSIQGIRRFNSALHKAPYYPPAPPGDKGKVPLTPLRGYPLCRPFGPPKGVRTGKKETSDVVKSFQIYLMLR